MKQKPPSRAAKPASPRADLTANAASGNAAPSGASFVRSNPRPFNLHLFTTACMLTAAAWPMAGDPDKRDRVIKLVSDMAGDMMRGLGAYKTAPAHTVTPDYDVVWKDGSSRLLRIDGAHKNAAHVLLVPSLINRFNILDLDAQHSFARHLVKAGYAPFILDWGAPEETEQSFTIDDYILRRLYPALDQLHKPHVMGYCMGGTIAAGAITAMDDQTRVRSLTMLAAPWDFHAGDKSIALRMQAFAMSAEGVMQSTGVLPVDWIQALFASIDPLFAFNKFRAFADMESDSPEARRFVIVEDWLNDGVDLAAPAAKQVLLQWYGLNEPVSGVWTIGKKLVDAANIKVPVLTIAASGDRLVPQPHALGFHAQIAAGEKRIPDIGHIGMMASTRAAPLVWDEVVEWLGRQP